MSEPAADAAGDVGRGAHSDFVQYAIGVYQCCSCRGWLYSFASLKEHIINPRHVDETDEKSRRAKTVVLSHGKV